MTELILTRMVDAPDSHTFGRLEDGEHKRICYTLEEPWRDVDKDGFGDTGVSRIPAGRYPWRLAMSPKRGYEVLWVDKVPHRVAVQIHRGNTVDDTEGCILVGTSFGSLSGKSAVLDSKTAFAALLKALNGATSGFITVADVPPKGPIDTDRIRANPNWPKAA